MRTVFQRDFQKELRLYVNRFESIQSDFKIPFTTLIHNSVFDPSTRSKLSAPLVIKSEIIQVRATGQ